MMKYVNGKPVEMTEAEIEELKAELPEIPQQVKSRIEERLDEMEKWRTRIASFLERLGLVDGK